jgi:membrane AbrB-like protein
MARRAGLNRPTGIIGSIPGGLTQMVVLGEEVADTDVTAVTFMQTVRMLAVVFIVPFLAVHGLGSAPVGAATGNSGAAVSGATGLLSVRIVASIAAVLAGTWAAVKLKLPTPYLMGPMLAAGLLAIGGVAVPQVPAPLLLVAQLCVGSHLGLTMKSTSLGNWKRLLPCCLLSSGGLVLFSLMLGFFLKMWHPIDLVTGFLGTAPGGMAEMGATAVAVHADLSVVAAYQMFRILFILFVVPPLLKWWLKR